MLQSTATRGSVRPSVRPPVPPSLRLSVRRSVGPSHFRRGGFGVLLSSAWPALAFVLILTTDEQLNMAKSLREKKLVVVVVNKVVQIPVVTV